MQISINTPALLFPAITLMMLAYTNRFLGLATLVRKLHQQYKESNVDKELVKEQIVNLRRRLNLVKQMQASGIFALFLCVLCMLAVYFEQEGLSYALFAMSLLVLLLSLGLSLNEIYLSTRALEIELKDME
ncbi:MAG: DUF2721 domain-containing protein [Cyclobacteriaceae bacterium]|jgi:hypothetical protein|nr:DUF2721 domain-containing protein [Cyclobacteriaceae bacterium]